MKFPLKLTPDDNGTLLVTCPLLPEVTTFGETAEDAARHAVAAIEEALAARMARGEVIPTAPSMKKGFGVSLPLLTTLKVSLWLSCRAAGVAPAELARRLEWHREQVDRLFRLDHKSRLDQLEAAFKAIGIDLQASFHLPVTKAA